MPVTNLIFGGPAVDGTPYVGALKGFQKQTNTRLKDIKRVAGASTGAIIAMMVALNYKLSEIETFFHREFDATKVGKVSEKNKCDYDGHKLEEIIGALIRNKHGDEKLTFADLKEKGYKELHIITTMAFIQNDRPQATRHEFSPEYTPETEILPVVLAAASTPGVYPMVLLSRVSDGRWVRSKESKHNRYHHIDGTLGPQPLLEELFDHAKYLTESDDKPNDKPMDSVINPETLCFIIASKEVPEATMHPISSDQSGDLLYALSVAIVEDIRKNLNLTPKSIARTIQLESKIPPKLFGTDRQKRHADKAAEAHVIEQLNLHPRVIAQDAKLSSTPTQKHSFFNSSPSLKPASGSPKIEGKEEKPTTPQASTTPSAGEPPSRCVIM